MTQHARAAWEEAFDAVVLVGGGGTRLGGVDKAAVDLAGSPLVAASLEAAAGARTLVVVGRTRAPLPARALVTLEEPPGSGPAAAFARGVAVVENPAPWTLLLACDVPAAREAVRSLLAAIRTGRAGGDGAVIADPSGRAQWVLGLYRTAAVRDAAARTPTTDRSLRRLLGDLDIERIPARAHEWHDIDTWDDHERWAARLTPREGL